MKTGKIVALSGTGKIAKIVYSGLAALTFYKAKNSKDFNFYNFDISTTVVPDDYKTLVKAYKKVQRKYYTENDILIKSKDKQIF